MHSEIKNEKLVFTADSDAILTKGIVALILRVYSNQSPKNINNVTPRMSQKEVFEGKISQLVKEINICVFSVIVVFIIFFTYFLNISYTYNDYLRLISGVK